jgi:hypothetical protein
VALLLQRRGQVPYALAGPPQQRLRIPPRRRFDQPSRSGTNVGSLRIAGLRPAPGRRTRPDGSSCANSFRPARSCSAPSRSPAPPR